MKQSWDLVKVVNQLYCDLYTTWDIKSLGELVNFTFFHPLVLLFQQLLSHQLWEQSCTLWWWDGKVSLFREIVCESSCFLILGKFFQGPLKLHAGVTHERYLKVPHLCLVESIKWIQKQTEPNVAPFRFTRSGTALRVSVVSPSPFGFSEPNKVDHKARKDATAQHKISICHVTAFNDPNGRVGDPQSVINLSQKCRHASHLSSLIS